MIKLFIATPMYGGQCFGDYVVSLLALQDILKTNGIESFYSCLFNEALITRARNTLVHQFMNSNCTHLLFIDADIKFNAQEIYQMLFTDKDVICGIYPKKSINWEYVSNAVKEGTSIDNLKDHTGNFVVNMKYTSTTFKMNEPFEINNGGTGMMLIKKNVFEKLKETTPSYINDQMENNFSLQERIHAYFDCSIDEFNHYLSEDYHFCKLWQKIGGTIWAAPWVSLCHNGTYRFEGKFLAHT